MFAEYPSLFNETSQHSARLIVVGDSKPTPAQLAETQKCYARFRMMMATAIGAIFSHSRRLTDGSLLRMDSRFGQDTVYLTPASNPGAASQAPQKPTLYEQFYGVPVNDANAAGITALGPLGYWQFDRTPTKFPAALKPVKTLTGHTTDLDREPGHVTWSNPALKIGRRPIVVSWKGPRNRYSWSTGWSGSTIVAHSDAGTPIGNYQFTDQNAIWINGNAIAIDNAFGYKIIAACLHSPAPGLFVVRAVTDKYPATATARSIAVLDLVPTSVYFSGAAGAGLQALCNAKTLEVKNHYIATQFSSNPSAAGQWNMLQRPHFNASGTQLATIVDHHELGRTGIVFDAETWATVTSVSAPFTVSQQSTGHQITQTTLPDPSTNVAGAYTGSRADSYVYTENDSFTTTIATDFDGDTFVYVACDVTFGCNEDLESHYTVNATYTSGSSSSSVAQTSWSETETWTQTCTCAWTLRHNVLGTLKAHSWTADASYSEAANGDSRPRSTAALASSYQFSVDAQNYIGCVFGGDLSTGTFFVGYPKNFASVAAYSGTFDGSGNANGWFNNSLPYTRTTNALRYQFDTYINGLLAASGTNGSFVQTDSSTSTASNVLPQANLAATQYGTSATSGANAVNTVASGAGLQIAGVANTSTPPDQDYGKFPLGTPTLQGTVFDAVGGLNYYIPGFGTASESVCASAVTSLREIAYLSMLDTDHSTGLEIGLFNKNGTLTVSNPPAYAGGTDPRIAAPVFCGPIVRTV